MCWENVYNIRTLIRTIGNRQKQLRWSQGWWCLAFWPQGLWQRVLALWLKQGPISWSLQSIEIQTRKKTRATCDFSFADLHWKNQKSHRAVRYGGVILESSYSDVPFGTPATVIRLGTTLRQENIGNKGKVYWKRCPRLDLFHLFFFWGGRGLRSSYFSDPSAEYKDCMRVENALSGAGTCCRDSSDAEWRDPFEEIPLFAQVLWRLGGIPQGRCLCGLQSPHVWRLATELQPLLKWIGPVPTSWETAASWLRHWFCET